MIRAALLLTLETPKVGLVIQQAGRMFKNGRHYLNPLSSSGSLAILAAIRRASIFGEQLRRLSSPRLILEIERQPIHR